MNEASVPGMPEVKRGQVDEVQDDYDLRPSEVGAHEKHNESEMEEVVENWRGRWSVPLRCVAVMYKATY